MTIPRPLIPNEHGACAVLFVPMAVAATAVGSFSFNLVLLTLSALSWFMAYRPASILLRDSNVSSPGKEKLRQARFWATVYLSAGLVFLALLLGHGFWLLLPIGALSAGGFLGSFFLSRRRARTIPGDLLAVVGLTLSAPGTYYVGAGSLNSTSFFLWLMNFLFFGCSVFYVHMKMHAASSKKQEFDCAEKLSIGKWNVFYHIAIMVVVGALALVRYMSWFAVLAFVPMTMHAIYGTHRLSSDVRFKNLGLLLLGQSIAFGIILGVFPVWQMQ